MKKNERNMASNTGCPIDDDLSSFNTEQRKRFPERVVYAKRYGMRGTFEVTHDVSSYTCADFLSPVGKQTPMVVRFSSLGGEKGDPEVLGDPCRFVMMLYTDEGNNTHKWYNTKGDFVWIKWRFKKEEGIEDLTNSRVKKPVATSPDYTARDLYENIKAKELPGWRVYVQMMKPEEGELFPYDPFNYMQSGSQVDSPLIPVGRFVLHQPVYIMNQAVFSRGDIVSGKAASLDKKIQTRLFSYADTQKHKQGSNFDPLRINKPLYSAFNHQRDSDLNIQQDSSLNYDLNFVDKVSANSKYVLYSVDACGMTARYKYKQGGIDFKQAGIHYSSMLNDYERSQLIGTMVSHLKKVQERTQLRQTTLFYKVAEDYGTRVAEGLGLKMEEVQKLAKMKRE